MSEASQQAAGVVAVRARGHPTLAWHFLCQTLTSQAAVGSFSVFYLVHVDINHYEHIVVTRGLRQPPSPTTLMCISVFLFWSV